MPAPIFEHTPGMKEFAMEFIDAMIVLAGLGSAVVWIMQPGWLRAWLQKGKKPESPLEIERKVYEDLKAKLAKQQTLTDNVIARVTSASSKLDKRRQELAAIEQEFIEKTKEKADEAFLNEIGARYAKANESIEKQTKVLADLKQLAADQTQTLQEHLQSVQEFEEKFELDQSYADLAEANRFRAEAKEHAKGINGTLTAAGQASRDIQRQLAESEASVELANGSKNEQERAALSQQYNAMTGREALERLASKAAQAKAEVEVTAPAPTNHTSGQA
jgi:hypothetical protein